VVVLLGDHDHSQIHNIATRARIEISHPVGARSVRYWKCTVGEQKYELQDYGKRMRVSFPHLCWGWLSIKPFSNSDALESSGDRFTSASARFFTTSYRNARWQCASHVA